MSHQVFQCHSESCHPEFIEGSLKSEWNSLDVYKKCVLDTPECFRELELTFFSIPHYSTTIHFLLTEPLSKRTLNKKSPLNRSFHFMNKNNENYFVSNNPCNSASILLMIIPKSSAFSEKLLLSTSTTNIFP